MILLLRIIVVGIKIIFGDFIVRLKGRLKSTYILLELMKNMGEYNIYRRYDD